MNDLPMTQSERGQLNMLTSKMGEVARMAAIVEGLADDVKEIRTALMGSKLTGDPGYGEKINVLKAELSQLKTDFDMERRKTHYDLNRSKYIRIGMSLSIGLIGGLLGVAISLVTFSRLFGV